MKKILLHIGQPKTATTTLQHHFFEKLHQKGQINFLGKLLKFDKQTKTPIFLRNDSKLLRDIFEGKRKLDDITLIEPLLKNDMLNVFSDEGLLVYYPGRDNITLEGKIKRIKSSLSNYDVEVVINLRNPVDSFYSLYVQLFLQFYKCNNEFNSFSKYVSFFKNNPHHPMFESFYYQDLLQKLHENFRCHTLLFEDMIHDKNTTYARWSEIIGIPKEEVASYLDNKHENKKNKINNFISTPSNVYSYLPKIKKTLAPYPILYKGASKIYKIKNRTLRRAINLNFPFLDDKHYKPDVDQTKMLQKALSLKDNFPFEDYGLTIEKLIQYNYIVAEK